MKFFPDSRWLRDNWPAFPIAFLAVLYFWNVLSGRYLLTERDLTLFFIPPRLFWLDEIKNHTFPLWNPYFNGGHPLFATLQTGVLYPFSLLFLFLPFAVAFNWTIVLHFAIAGVSMFALLRAQKAGSGASYVAAICFIFGGYMLSVHNVLSTLLSVTWVPLFLLVYFAGFRRRNIRWALGAGAVGTMMFLGGGVEVCYLTFGLVFLITLIPQILFEESAFPDAKFRILYFASFVLAFFGLSAFQLLPFLELTRLSIRAHGLPYSEAVTWSLHPRDILTFFLPDVYGYRLEADRYWSTQNWLKSIYLGFIPFILSLFFFQRRDRKAHGFVILIIISFILALGGYSLIYPCLYLYLPFLNKIRYPVKFIFASIILIAMAAGFGFDEFKKGLKDDPDRLFKWTRWIFVFGFLCMVLFGILNSYEGPIAGFFIERGWTLPDYNDINVNLGNLKRVLCFASLSCLVLFLCFRIPRLRKYFLFGLMVLLTFDLFFSHQGFYAKTETQRYLRPSANMKFILSDPGLFRVLLEPRTVKDMEDIVVLDRQDPLDMMKEKIQPGFGLKERIFHAWGVSVTVQWRLKNIYDLIATAPAPDSTNLLKMMNVKYLISIPPVKSPEFKLVHMNIPPIEGKDLEGEKTIKIYENLKVLPRAFLVNSCAVMKSREDYRRMFSSKAFEPGNLVLLDAEPEGFPCKGTAAEGPYPGDSVKITDYRSTAVELEVKTASRQILFLSESFYPGWKATVDERPTRILRANYVFRALVLEPGDHRVRFEYRPLSFALGAGITCITLLFCLALIFKKRRAADEPK